MAFDTELSPSEQAYFSSGGDASAYLAEHGRSQTEVEDDGAPALSHDEEHYFRSGGDVTDGLRRQYSDAPAREPEPKFRPEVQRFIDDALAALAAEFQDERVKHARTAARLELLQEAVTPPPEPRMQPLPRLAPEDDLFRYVRDIGDRLDRYDQQVATGQREMTEDAAYRSALQAAIHQDPSVVEAYKHLIGSRATELMASRYPQATHEQLVQAVVNGQIPDDIQQALVREERSIYRDAFQNRRNPAEDIVRFAQVRGYRSPTQIEAARGAQAEQQRRAEAKRAAEQRKAAEIAEEARSRFARKKALFDQATLDLYNTSARTRDHRRWFYDGGLGRDPICHPIFADRETTHDLSLMGRAMANPVWGALGAGIPDEDAVRWPPRGASSPAPQKRASNDPVSWGAVRSDDGVGIAPPRGAVPLS